MKTNDSDQNSQQSSNMLNQLSAQEEVKNQITSDISQDIPTECTDTNNAGSVISETRKNDVLALTNYL